MNATDKVFVQIYFFREVCHKFRRLLDGARVCETDRVKKGDDMVGFYDITEASHVFSDATDGTGFFIGDDLVEVG